MRKAQAEIVAGIIVLSAMVLMLIPFLLSLISFQGEAVKRHGDIASYHHEKLIERTRITQRERCKTLVINNTGLVTLTFTIVLIKDLNTGSLYLVNLTKYSPSLGWPIRRITVYPEGREVQQEPIILPVGHYVVMELNNPSLWVVVLWSTRNVPHIAPLLECLPA
ncbi:MAG: hypothetical protein ABDH61_00620 [Acidilobaceae archaeon]